MDPRYNAEPPNPTEPPYQKELDALQGMHELKEELRCLAAVAKVNKERKKAGMPLLDVRLHMAFTGRPGTGKTTVARIMASFLKHHGFLTKGHLIETSRTMLMEGYIGQTDKRTREKLQESIGGVFFCDEFPQLCVGGDDARDFGRRVIDAMVPFMENERNVAVIIAGYRAEMKNAMLVDPGLTSRIGTIIDFPDFTAEQMIDIFAAQISEIYVLSDDAYPMVGKVIRNHCAVKGDNFGNARDIRNLVDAINRISSVRLASNPTNLATLTADDIAQAAVRARLSGA